MKAAIISEQKCECLTDHVASIGVDEFRMGLELLVSLLIKSETTGYELPSGLWLDSRSQGVNSMAAIPKFDEANLQALSDSLGDTSTGLTGSEIGRFLR